jgi:nicotinamide mononucleotide transporter
MLYTVLAGKGKAVCFLFGLVNTPLYAYLACKAGYYGDFVLNIYYFAMMFPGLVAFLRHRAEDDEESIRRTRLSRKGRTVLVLFSAAGTLALGAVLSVLGGTRPFCDAATNILSVAAMYLTVRRALEQWVLWIAVDVLEVFMWAKIYAAGESHISILMMWLLFLTNGIYLLAMWLRIEARKTASVNAPPARFRQAGAPHP